MSPALPPRPDLDWYRKAAKQKLIEWHATGDMKSIEVIRLVVDGEHCVAIVNIDTVFGVIPFAEHIHVANGQIVSIRGYCDPRPMRSSAPSSPPS